MTTGGLVISGWGAVSPDGIGVPALVDRHAAGTPPALTPAGDPPEPSGYAYAGFDPRRELGRKGTSFYDRATALAAVACGEALRDSALPLTDDGDRSRVGLVLGTTLGSFKSTSDFTRETLVQDKPYLVNPVLFPNTVMNCAAGQAAIRHGLRGVNATIAGGPTAFLSALRYADNALTRGYADAILVGAVEEFSAHRAWTVHLTGPDGSSRAAGEGAAVFTIERSGVPRRGAHHDAEVLAVATGFGPGPGGGADALAACVRRVLARVRLPEGEPSLVVSGEWETGDRSEYDAVVSVLGRRPRRLLPKSLFGECDAAHGALGLAVLLGLHRAEPERDGTVTLLTARGGDGAAAAALVRGWGRGGRSRG
ncbi:beta-ketoacyl synthase N-terminal-like domain-containing protein [Micromonospora sp. CPCC 206061]|uniref:beta-ketoacyl synthase N-terminal-like domain-containing protein n=1 Tax=Micromonospora sp. CPCC 206061 TaxID=3122410 RepID=UPI002FF1B324